VPEKNKTTPLNSGVFSSNYVAMRYVTYKENNVISYQFDETYDSADVINNPEIALMMQQGYEDECDVHLSLWLAGTAATSTKHSNYDN
jgi:hypothetical protein